MADEQGPGRPTLLPSSVAQAVSLATRSTSLAVRLGSLVGCYSLDAARFTTISSLELARGVVEVVLSRAGRDTLVRSHSDLAAAEAETILERTLERFHAAVTQVVFWTTAGFHLTGSSLAAASEASQLGLSFLDQLFGSTESSRAIASIITLIRREFQNPATGVQGEKVGVFDLLVAMSAIAYLQQKCRRTVQEDRRRRAYEEVIWDVVVLNDGERIDVHENSLSGCHPGHYPSASRCDAPRSPDDLLGPQSARWKGIEDDEAVFSRLKGQIAASLPPGTTVSLSNSVSAVQTITIDVQGPEPIAIMPPPGAEVVEAEAPRRKKTTPDDNETYRIVYKIQRNKVSAAAFQHEDGEGEPAITEITSPTLSTSSSSQESLPLPSPTTLAPPPPPRAPSPIPTIHCNGAENTANQKKTRMPPSPSRNDRGGPGDMILPDKAPKPKSTSRKRTESSLAKVTEKRAGLRQVLRGSSQSISNIWNAKENDPSGKPRPQWKSPGAGASAKLPKPPPPRRRHQSQPSNPPPGPSRHLQTPEPPGPRSSSRTSYVSIHERRRDSVVSQTDSYSLDPAGGLRPASPTVVRREVTANESLSRPHERGPSPSPRRSHHRRNAASLYSLQTNDSQTSLILSSYYQKSAYSASDALSTLRRNGIVSGTFPDAHLLRNITRYMRYSSASYGSHFLKYMGISKELPILRSWDEGTHHDVRHFVHHTESHADSVLLASFVDPSGGSDASGETGTGVPLVHYISLDHEAKAVVLVCRGTLGFEDVMADMTCDYDYLVWHGRKYKVHKGVLASARRLLYGGDGRVLVTLSEALREFPDYGLVLCGHSLGGAVTALLGAMLAEPNPHGPGFVTSLEPHQRLLTASRAAAAASSSEIRLPAGRRIHVYAYGSPGVMSRSLSKITRGLITTVVHGNDLVPHLSLGVLHDMQAVALSFRNDDSPTSHAKHAIRQHLWSAVVDKWNGQAKPADPPPMPDGAGRDDDYDALTAIRATMKNEKLYPPGEVFSIEVQRVLRRDAFVLLDEEHIGQPAQRVVLKYIRDVEARFGEVRFGTSMLMDHNPAKYEDALNKLRLGVAE
ncbi:hypothetical protein B0I35DRAFT_453795 [Stachybotrys elegans]|uniref:sn-1-specific diacylglycerol lipase n=1 Tax=Stachybotrys elegans TaxID=80388 RepID=A0A8K0SL35_9HYPO|nr:hypothetical protein B0I35DRAFT_453795 [Stachybotrys elegans]